MGRGPSGRGNSVDISYRECFANGRRALAEGRLDEAVAAFRAAAILRPADAAAHLELATSLRRAGLIEAARQAFTRAIAVSPDGAAAVRARAALGSSRPHRSSAAISASGSGCTASGSVCSRWWTFASVGSGWSTLCGISETRGRGWH
ncbi:tetratricopeptide repeat protein [Actinomadura yumaensis]|uniref:tetratricopeptide repeat protein n=1 Tax=Actinomadura TaxID=1988 RepID=UPI00132811CD|nr:tetratricopeptide repeat protein [Actinomadura sp. J1-007]